MIIRFYFYSVDDLISKIIQRRTVSNYNHVAVATINNGIEYVYQVWTKGVVKEIHPMNGYNKEKTRLVYIDIPVNKDKFREIQEYLDKQVGRKYDWLAIWGFGLGSYEQDRKRWFCSELAEVILEKIEEKQIRRRKLVSPELILIYLMSRGYTLHYW